MKLCVECNHYKYSSANIARCWRPGLISPVYGQDSALCNYERDSTLPDKCGPKGKYWEERVSFWKEIKNFILK